MPLLMLEIGINHMEIHMLGMLTMVTEAESDSKLAGRVLNQATGIIRHNGFCQAFTHRLLLSFLNVLIKYEQDIDTDRVAYRKAGGG